MIPSINSQCHDLPYHVGMDVGAESWVNFFSLDPILRIELVVRDDLE